MNQEQEWQIVGYYSTAGKYIYNKCYSNRYRAVFTKEDDKYQWLVLERRSGNQTEVRQTDRHGKVIARDNYMLKKCVPVCMSAERLCKDSKSKVHFTADDIRLICRYGTAERSETCVNLCTILIKIKENDVKQLVNAVLRKLNTLAEGSCTEFLTVLEKQKWADGWFDNRESVME